MTSIDLAGIPQGLGIYVVTASLDTAAKGGWEGNRQLPTMWIVGGTAGDALTNARTVLDAHVGRKLDDGARVVGIRVRVDNADMGDSRDEIPARYATVEASGPYAGTWVTPTVTPDAETCDRCGKRARVHVGHTSCCGYDGVCDTCADIVHRGRS